MKGIKLSRSKKEGGKHEVDKSLWNLHNCSHITVDSIILHFIIHSKYFQRVINNLNLPLLSLFIKHCQFLHYKYSFLAYAMPKKTCGVNPKIPKKFVPLPTCNYFYLILQSQKFSPNVSHVTTVLINYV